MGKKYTKRKLPCSVVGTIGLVCALSVGSANGYASTLSASLRTLRHTPSPYECAVLSAHVYQENSKEGDLVVVHDAQSGTAHALHDWKVDKIFHDPPTKKKKRKKKKRSPHGYRGVLYVNSTKQQMVLAHRGTVLNLGSLKTDIFAIIQNIIIGQERLLPKVLHQALTSAEKEGCSFAVTGHSLGGWLAQLTAFIAQDNKQHRSKLHVKAVTFDTPGARPMLEQMNPKNEGILLDQLDITNYLSAPNLINACNLHVGTLYRVVFDEFPAASWQYTLASHAMHNFLKAFDPSTGTERQCVLVKSWPLVAKASLKKAGQGLTKLLSGQLIEAMGSFLGVLKAASEGAIMGQYSGFFKFAHKTNHYHPDGLNLEEDSQEDFELKYKYHYHTEPFDPSSLPSRQLPTPVRDFITHLGQGTGEVAATMNQSKELHGLDWDSHKGILYSTLEEDIRTRVDRLLTVALHYPDLCAKGAPIKSSTFSHRGPRMRQLLMPPSIPFFVGREKLLAQLNKAYRNKTKRVVQLLAGPGGMGKTQMALSVYHTVQEEEYAHTFWIPAETREKLTSAYLDMAEILGVYIDKQQVEKTIQEVRVRLAEQSCFYVFDNAPNHDAIESFLPLQRGHVLITSRNSAAHSWEHATQRVSLPPFDKKEIVALATKSGCPLDPKDRATLHCLLEKMSGYPLALAQFFSLCKMQGYSPADFVKELQGQPPLSQDEELVRLLAANPTGSMKYDKSILQVLRTSLEQLEQVAYGERAAELLSRLAYLDPKGVPVDWLLTFLPEDCRLLKRETRAALALLEQYSLVQWDRERAQLYIHEVIQQVIRHLHPQPSLEKLIASLVTYVGEESDAEQYASRWVALLSHGRMLRARLNSTQYPQEAYALTKYLARACQSACLFEERLQWSQERLAIAQQRYPTQDHPDTANALMSMGRSLVRLGKEAEGLGYHKQALAMHQRLYKGQDHPDIAYALNGVGASLVQLGKPEEGLGCLKQGLGMRQRIYKDQDHPYTADSLDNVGRSLGRLGRLEEGLDYLKQGLVMRQGLYKNQDHPYMAASLDNVGVSLLRLGQLEEGLTYHQQAMEMRQRVYQGQDHPEVAKSLHNMGYTVGRLGKLEEGLAYLEQALAMRQRLYNNQDHPETALSLNNVGYLLVQLGKSLEEGLAYFKRGLAMQKRVYQGQDHPYIAYSMDNVGYVLVQLGQLEKGVGCHQQAMEMRQRIFGNLEHPDTARSLHNMGDALGKLGKLKEGLAYLEKALAMQQLLYKNQDHPDIAYTLSNAGIILEKLGRLEEGLAYLEQGLAMQQRVFGNQDHPYTANSLSNVGGSLVQLGKLEKGLAYHQQAMEMMQRVFGDQDHPDAARSLHNMGYALGELCNLQEGLAYLERALAMRQRLYKEKDHPYTAYALINMGGGLVRLGKLEEGLAYHQQAMEMMQRIFGDQDHPDAARSLHDIGYTLGKLGKLKDGLEYLEQALAMRQRLYKNQAHPDIGYTLNDVGVISGKLGKLEESLGYLKQSLAMRQRVFGNQDHPYIAYALSNVGASLVQLGKLEKGLAYHQQAIEMLRRVFGNQDHHGVAYSLHNIGLTLGKLGKLKEGLAYLEKALAMQQRLYKNQEHPVIAYSLNDVGEGLVRSGKLEEGLAYLEQGLVMRKRLYKNQDHPDTVCAMSNVGVSLVQWGKLEEGLAYHQQAMEMLQRVFGDQDLPDAARSLHNMGYTLGKLGRLEEGLAYLEQGLAMQQRLYKNQKHPDIAYSLHNVGYTLVQSGKLKEGLAYHRQGLAMRQQLYKNQDHPDTAYALNHVGVSLAQLGKLEEGLTYHQQAMGMQQRVFGNQEHPWTADMCYSMGDALVKARFYQKALTLIKASLAMQKRIYRGQDHPLLAATYYSSGEALQGLDKLGKAVPYYSQAVSIALRLYKKEYPYVTQYLDSLIKLLNRVTNRTIVRKTQEALLPLCIQWLGEDHTLTRQLRDAGQVSQKLSAARSSDKKKSVRKTCI
jgi:tetratricopeptide (TPR) repeat protein